MRFETIATFFMMLAVLLKLNIAGKHTFFGRAVPGHGAPEKSIHLVVKKIVLIIVILIILGVFMMAFDLL